MSQPFNDGGLQRGSKILTILELGEKFIAENFSLTRGTQTHRQYSSTNQPLRQKHDRDFVDGSANLQKHSSASEILENYTFAVGSHGYQIQQVGEEFPQNGANMLPIEFTRCENPLITQPAVQIDLTQNTAIDSGDACDVEIPSRWTASDISSLAYAATNLPTGVSISSSTGEITGTPTAVETVTATITVTCTETTDEGEAITRTGTRQVVFDVVSA